MTTPYRLYFRDQYNRIVCRIDQLAMDDAGAVRLAEILSSICADLCDTFEVWQAARCVLPVSKVRRDDFTADVSPEIHELLETVLRSNWPLAESRKLQACLDGLGPLPRRGDDALRRILTTAVGATGADFGTLQRTVGDALHIAAQYGFDRDFLSFFAVVNDTSTSCGMAGRGAQRVIMEDVRVGGVYDPAGLQAMLKGGCVSCQSTPLVTPSGSLVGVISTHRRVTWRPTQAELQTIDRYAAEATAVLASA